MIRQGWVVLAGGLACALVAGCSEGGGAGSDGADYAVSESVMANGSARGRAAPPAPR